MGIQLAPREMGIYDCPFDFHIHCEQGVSGLCFHQQECQDYHAKMKAQQGKFGIFNAGKHKRSNK